VILSDPSQNNQTTEDAETMVRLWYPLITVPAAGEARVDTLVRIGAAPWAVRGGGYLVIASPLDVAATDLPLAARFVPWFATLLTQRLDPGEVGVLETTPGALLTIPRGVDALEMSDGAIQPLTAGKTIDAPWRAGVAFWQRGGARVGALVVNPEPSESDPPTDSMRRRSRGYSRRPRSMRIRSRSARPPLRPSARARSLARS